ncbi:MAG: MATE family efflux transporter, partial [Pseudomonadota bacterium]
MTQRAWPAWARASEIVDLLRLSLPIAVSRMSMMLMSVTDAIVLGQFDEAELPFVLNSWLPIGVALGLGMGLLLGVQVLTSEMLGRNEARHSGRVFRRGFIWAVGLGLVSMIVVYWGAEPLFRWVFVDINPNSSISATLTPGEVAGEITS